MKFAVFNQTFDIVVHRHDAIFHPEANLVVYGHDGVVLEERSPDKNAYTASFPDGGWARLVFHTPQVIRAAIYRGGELYLIDPVERHLPTLSHGDRRQLRQSGASMVAHRPLGGAASAGGSGRSMAMDYVRSMLKKSSLGRRLATMDQSWAPAQYKGPYGKMASNCPVTMRMFDLYIASDAGFSRRVTAGTTAATTTSTTVNVAAVQKEMNYIMNVVNVLYTDQINVFVRIKTMDVRTQVGGAAWNLQPSAPSTHRGDTLATTGCSITDPSTYLSTATDWFRTQSARSSYGLYHFLTNCFPAPGTVGVAWLGVTCNNNNGVGFSSLTSSTWEIVAHEMGHNFGASHTFNTGGLMSYDSNPEYKFTGDNPSQVCGHVAAASSSSSTCYSNFAATCGNNVIEPGEQCDEGGPTTCCSATCQLVSQCSTAGGNECCNSDCTFKFTTAKCNGGSSYCNNGKCVGKNTCNYYSNTLFCGMVAGSPCKQECKIGASGTCRLSSQIDATNMPPNVEDGAYCGANQVCSSGNCITAATTPPPTVTPKTVTVTAPAPLTTWVIGRAYTVTWTSTGDITAVAVTLVSTGGNTVLSASTANDGSFTWSAAAGGVGGGHTIKVSDAADAAISGSSTPFTLEPAPAVTTVTTASAVWTTGSQQGITWSTAGSIASVKIVLRRGGATVATIASSTANDGSATYVVPASMAQATGYTVRVSSTADSAVRRDSAALAVETAKSLLITSPTAGSTLQKGTSQTITWSSTGTIPTVDIRLYKGSTQVATVATGVATSAGTYTWTPAASLTAGNDYKLRLFVSSSLADYSDVFAISDVPQSVALSSPTAASSWQLGSAQSVTWSITGASFPTRVELHSGAAVVRTIATLTAAQTATGSVPYTVPATLSAGPYRVSITHATDASKSSFSAYFQLTPPPSLTFTSPSGGSTTYTTGSSQAVRWSSTALGSGTTLKLELVTAANAVAATLASALADDGLYTWAIAPSLAAGSYTLRLTASGGGGVTGTSVAFQLSKPATVTVTTPGGGGWVVGSAVTAQWATTGAIARVNVALYSGGGALALALATDVPNTGSATVTLPSSLTPATYTLRVTSAADAAVSGSSAAFAVTAQPSVVVTAPSGGGQLTMGTSLTLTWTSTGIAQSRSLKIELVKGGANAAAGAAVSTLAAATPNDGRFSWNIATNLAPGSDYGLRLSDTTAPATFFYSAQFSLAEAITLSLSAPAAGASFTKGGAVTVTFTSTGALPTVGFRLLSGGSTVGATLSGLPASGVKNSGSYQWTIPAGPGVAAGSGYRIRVEGPNGQPQATSGTFAIADIPPAVPASFTVTAPLPTLSPAVGSSVAVAWSFTGDVTTVALDLVQGRSHKQVSAIAATAPNTGAFTYAVGADVPPGTQYAVKVSGGGAEGYSPLFTVAPVQPGITVTALFDLLQQGTEWNRGYDQTIRWSTQGGVGAVSLFLEQNGAPVATLATALPPSTTSFVYKVPYTTPPATGTGYRVRIQSVDDATVSAVSDSFPITTALWVNAGGINKLKMTSPVAGDAVAHGRPLQLTWSTLGAVDAVHLDLFSFGTWRMNLATGIPNSGAVNWTVLPSLPPTDSYSVRVQDAAATGAATLSMSSLFAVKAVPAGAAKTITVTLSAISGAGGSGKPVAVTWTSTGISVKLTLKVKDSAGRDVATLVTGAATAGQTTWAVSKTQPAGRYTVEATAADGSAKGVSDVFVLSEPSVLTAVDYPRAASVYRKGSTYWVWWKYTGPDFDAALMLYEGTLARVTETGKPCLPFRYTPGGALLRGCTTIFNGGQEWCAVSVEPTTQRWATRESCAPIVSDSGLRLVGNLRDLSSTATVAATVRASTTRVPVTIPASSAALPKPGTHLVKIVNVADPSVSIWSEPFQIQCARVRVTATLRVPLSQAQAGNATAQLKADLAAALGVPPSYFTSLALSSLPNGNTRLTLVMQGLSNSQYLCPDQLATALGDQAKAAGSPLKTRGGVGSLASALASVDSVEPINDSTVSASAAAFNLSPGGIAAIAGGTVAGLALIAAVALFLVRASKSGTPNAPSWTNAASSPGTSSSSAGAAAASRERKAVSSAASGNAAGAAGSGAAGSEEGGAWKTRRSTAAAQKFYVNPDTGETSWERPQSVQLPQGWAAVVDPASGKEYYHNAATGATQWDLPAGSSTNANALPDGWQEALSDGQTYYYNATTGETRWEKP